MRGRRSDLERVNLLDLAPVQIATWRDENGLVVVVRTPPPVRGLRGHLRHLFFAAGVRRLRLDELGTAVWRRLDGRTVAEVAAALRAEFGARCEPAEERLRLYLGMLRRERLIAFPGLDDAAIAEWREQSPPGRTP